MARKKSSKKNNPFLFTFSCVVLGLLVILIVFLVKKDQIFANLQETAFFDRVFGSTPEFVENHQASETKKKEVVPLNNDEVTIQIEKTSSSSSAQTEKSTKPAETKKEEAKKDETKDKQTEKTKEKTVDKQTEKKAEDKKETSPAKTSGTTELQLCFVVIDGDGSVVRKTIKRSVPKSDSPLTTAINLLLKGPDTTKSTEKNCMSLIPAGTKLLGARVSDGVAYLNFNENFEINSYGVEGYIYQLQQIVYTATAFSTVNSVQFLIEGEKRDYLGSEGQWIGSPLSRNSF